MPEFEDAQAELAQTRLAHHSARVAVLAAGEQLRKVQDQQRSLKRTTGDTANDEIAALAAREQELTTVLADQRTSEARLADQLLSREKLFQVFSDPREHISKLDDQYPILLFPVRMETRFKQVTEDNQVFDQLWLRIYPDDISIDTFEPLVADVELTTARIYWTNIWKAGGDEAEKRAAWRSLAKSHGAGRAHWILQQFAPTNAADEPAKAAGDHVLVVVTDQPLLTQERAPVEDYWRAVFIGGNDPVQHQAALDALVDDLGQARAEVIIRDYEPQNLHARVANPDAVTNVRVEFLELPPTDQIASQQVPWMNPANTALLPERFVVIGFDGDDQSLVHVGAPVPSELTIGPNPTATPDDQLRIDEDELVVPEPMRWMTDFDEAVRVGMGFRINLTPGQATDGFTRLFVLGVRMSADVENGTAQLETLFSNHQRSRKGMAILRQGAPTNNVEDNGSGYTWREDSEQSYDHFFVQDQADDPTDWRKKKDGRWLAELLGVDPEIMKNSPNYFATDQCEARAMNEALWPATLGYFMQQMMDPLFDETTINSTRSYFNRYVLGRGALPALRVGKQPYGILPVTPFDRMNWINRKTLADDRVDLGVPDVARYLPDLYELIKKVDAAWQAMVASVSFVGKPGVDAHQALLDVIGLHPGAVEFYHRYAESYAQLYNRFKAESGAAAADSLAANAAHQYWNGGLSLLADLGFEGSAEDIPEILGKMFLQTPNLLSRPLIDVPTPSESAPLQVTRADGLNYIKWLIMAVRDSHDTLRRQDGFADERPPRALLYHMLRHALDLGFVDTSLQLHRDSGVLDANTLATASKEPLFMHIQEAADDTGTPYRFLYKAEPLITGNNDLSIADFIPQILTTRDPYLNRQVVALEHLQDVPTARLERVLAEHVDCASYRFDAWWLGLLNLQLSLMRHAEEPSPEGAPAPASTRGCYIGAFGWVEELRPDNRQITTADLPPELNDIFNKPGEPILEEDDQNLGFIHAPSLDHAVTAAVLRNGYLEHASEQNPDSFSINLTSERVRLAMGVIEGVRNGQSLSSLLGYHLERALHDEDGLFLDVIIFELRKQFPLRANRFANTRTGNEVSIESIEARNVVDGLKLIEHVQDQPPADQSYPFGLDSALPEINDAASLSAINAAVDRIADINDAVADLAMAESVYQVVRGNYDRAGSTMEAYSKGNFPPTPEVVQTPRSGVTLTHRVGLHLAAGLDPDAPEHPTPRAKGEPAINAWLASLFPPMGAIFCMVDYFSQATNATETLKVTATDLGLAPADLLYMIKRDGTQDMQSLDDRIIFHMLSVPDVRVDADIKIRYRDKQPGEFSFFEVAPLVEDARGLLLRSRGLRASDTRLPNEAETAEDAPAFIRTIKITRVFDLLEAQNANLTALVSNLDVLLDEPDEEILSNNAIDNIDTAIDSFAAIADEMNRFGLPGTGIGFAWDWRREAFASMVVDLDELISRWQLNLTNFENNLLDYDALPVATPEAERITLLLKAGLLIATEVIPPPDTGDPADLRTELVGPRKSAFQAVLTDLENLVTGVATVSDLYKALVSRGPDIALHDPKALELEKHRTSIVSFAGKIRANATSLSASVTKRLVTATDLLGNDAETSPARRIDNLTQAMRQLTSEDFVVLPEFQIDPLHAAEWQNAFDHADQLTEFLRVDLGVDFPVDDWLYGVARVREKLQHMESATMFAEAFTRTAPTLTPLQFPYRVDDAWLALQIPETNEANEPFVIDEDKLLYSAHYPVAFNANDALHCGVLIDEWTEIIPTPEETTGLTFHYDRPNTEPPQSLLLALPADFTGSWVWQDLVDSLTQTLEFARKRAVEPQHIDNSIYSRFLPTILSSVTRLPIFPSLDYSFPDRLQIKTELD